MRNVKLLLVEDDEANYLVIKDLLHQIAPNQYTIEWAQSASLARNLLRENKYNLCLMDYHLGANDGIQLLRETSEIGYDGPVIMLTRQHDNRLDAEALAAGAVDYLVTTDLNATYLARAIRYALARKDMEAERLERLRAEAENRSKNEFLAHLSHELRTPLTAILGYTDLLINRSRDAEAKAHLRIVKRNGNHLLSLLNDVLDLSKIEAGKLEIEIRDLELSPFLADIQSLMNMSTRDKDLQLTFNTVSKLPQTIRTDPTRLRQILLNLLGNAIKFTDIGSVELHIGLVEKNHHMLIEFAVTDSGIGISKEDINKIFQPFAQARHNIGRHYAGTGLGLAISRQLAQRLGGNIEVVSEVNTGSTFKLTIHPGDLRNTDLCQLSIRHEITHTGPVQQPFLRGKVLVVDDLSDIRELVGHLIKQTGVMVEFASNGAEAVEKINAAESDGEPYGLVVMDIHMPIMDGHEATRLLRDQGFSSPIVALTAATMKGEKQRCLDSGFTAHMSKPVDASELLRAIAKHLAPTVKPLHNPVVLIVEDNADARAATTALVELLNWKVVSANTGHEAIRLVAKSAPATILLDIHLPDTDGYTLAAQLRSHGLRNTRIIALSGATLDTQKARAAGIDAHLLKPVGLEDLKNALNANTG